MDNQKVQNNHVVEGMVYKGLEDDDGVDDGFDIEKPIQEDPESSLSDLRRDSQHLQGQVEAVLFMTSRPLETREIAEILEASMAEVEQSLLALIRDYSFRENAALEIDDTQGYILQVRRDYLNVVEKMMPLEISSAALRTLSAIAIKAPVKQSDLVDWRGASAYEHIAELLSRKLISKKREGRSFILNTTPTFQQYFKLQGDKKDWLRSLR